MSKSMLLFIAAAYFLVSPARAEDFQGATHLTPYDEAPINYGKAVPTDIVARLQGRIDRGEITLEFDEKHGYLPSVLKALKVPESSQMLVFSKTSFQRDRIDPRHPRAIYMGDDAYIGFLPGSPLLELSVADPNLGAVFYTLDQRKAGRPKFQRSDQCLECHVSSKSMGVPGFVLRSFQTDELGVVDQNSGISQINHRTPIEERWGGWYVTGTHGDQKHLGNLPGKLAFERAQREPNSNGNLASLARFADLSGYPRPGSDIVALMTLEHQTHMHNYMTRLHYDAELALSQYGHLNYLKTEIEAFLRYLLFAEEAPLTAPIKGDPAFVADFEALGPRDKKGRSLRQFDLEERMFKYPCSYLIYSEAFDALPEKLKGRIYERLWEILSPRCDDPVYDSLSHRDRRAIREILIDTKPGLPEYWRKS